jgi:hypothetical protein
MNVEWSVRPKERIGRLRMGLTPDSVAEMASVYGAPGPLIRGSDAAADLDAMIADLNGSLSDDDIAALRAAAGGQAGLDRQNLEADRTPILLEYRDGRLDSVTVEARHAETHFEGVRIFSLAAVEALRLFERANGGPGRFRSDEAAFDNIAVSLFAFSRVSTQGKVEAMPDVDPDFTQRSITVRREPYKPVGEMDQFVEASFE